MFILQCLCLFYCYFIEWLNFNRLLLVLDLSSAEVGFEFDIPTRIQLFINPFALSPFSPFLFSLIQEQRVPSTSVP